MSSSKIFSLEQSALNPFLFAEVGIEASGQPLSVVSLLARRGKDPWAEAAVLAAMSAPEAIASLARTISSMPATLWPLPAATQIAGRLVAALPRGGPAAVAVTSPVGTLVVQWRWVMTAVGLLLALGMFALQSCAIT